MSISCPNCKKDYNISLFDIGKTLECPCGYEIPLTYEQIIIELDRFVELLY